MNYVFESGFKDGQFKGRADCLAEIKAKVESDKYFNESDKHFILQILEEVKNKH
jgi:hypothetical protein